MKHKNNSPYNLCSNLSTVLMKRLRKGLKISDEGRFSAIPIYDGNTGNIDSNTCQDWPENHHILLFLTLSMSHMQKQFAEIFAQFLVCLQLKGQVYFI